MDELLAIVGGSWQPLLVYPGVLTSALVTLIVGALWSAPGAAIRQPSRTVSSTPGTLLRATCALLLIVLLPVPRFYWAYPIDLIVALSLLEIPHWLWLVSSLRGEDSSSRVAAASDVAALLNVYVLLALAVAALGQASGSLVFTELKAGSQTLRWAGLASWILMMPPLLGLGPWDVGRGPDWGADLRRVAHVALLLALALPAGEQWGYGATALGAVVAFGSLTTVHYLWRDGPERWERLQPVIALLLLALLLGNALEAWAIRLR